MLEHTVKIKDYFQSRFLRAMEKCCPGHADMCARRFKRFQVVGTLLSNALDRVNAEIQACRTAGDSKADAPSAQELDLRTQIQAAVLAYNQAYWDLERAEPENWPLNCSLASLENQLLAQGADQARALQMDFSDLLLVCEWR